MSPPAVRVLCATDLAPRSEAAIERAGYLADRLAAELTLLHVVAPADSERALEQNLQQAQERLRARTRQPLWRGGRLPGTAIRAGNPLRLVVDEVVNGLRPDLLVLGPHRPRPLRDALEGTIAGRVLASRACAVLMVSARPRAPYHRVLLALDESPASAGAITAAERLVLSDDVSARIVHADEPPYGGMMGYANVSGELVAEYVRGWRNLTTRGMREFVGRMSDDPGRFSIHVEAGNTVRGILGAVEQFGPDLLMLGSRGGGRLHRALLGSVANSVILEVSCDVMVVPVGAFQTLDAERNASVDPFLRGASRSAQPGAVL